MQNEVFVTEPYRLAEHVGPGLDIGAAVGDGFVAPEAFEVAEGEVFEDEREVLVFGGEYGMEFDDIWVA